MQDGGGREQVACVGAGEGQMEDSQPRHGIWRGSPEGNQQWRAELTPRGMGTSAEERRLAGLAEWGYA